MSDLNPKHELFINEYLQTFNATRSYLKIYPDSGEEAARRSASDLLTNPDIKSEIEKRIDLLRERVPSDIIQHLKNLIFFNPADLLDDNGNIDPTKLKENKVPGIISSITVDEKDNEKGSSRRVSFKLTDQNKAIELMSKILKLYEDKNELNINKPITINFIPVKPE